MFQQFDFLECSVCHNQLISKYHSNHAAQHLFASSGVFFCVSRSLILDHLRLGVSADDWRSFPQLKLAVFYLPGVLVLLLEGVRVAVQYLWLDAGQLTLNPNSSNSLSGGRDSGGSNTSRNANLPSPCTDSAWLGWILFLVFKRSSPFVP